MKTNSVNPKYAYAGGNAPPRLGAKRGTGNPDANHSNRKSSRVRSPSSSRAGLQGLSIGAKVPMKIFEQNYKQKGVNAGIGVTEGMAQRETANAVKKKVKKAAKKSNKFMGLGGSEGTL